MGEGEAVGQHGRNSNNNTKESEEVEDDREEEEEGGEKEELGMLIYMAEHRRVRD